MASYAVLRHLQALIVSVLGLGVTERCVQSAGKSQEESANTEHLEPEHVEMMRHVLHSVVDGAHAQVHLAQGKRLVIGGTLR